MRGSTNRRAKSTPEEYIQAAKPILDALETESADTVIAALEAEKLSPDEMVVIAIGLGLVQKPSRKVKQVERWTDLQVRTKATKVRKGDVWDQLADQTVDPTDDAIKAAKKLLRTHFYWAQPDRVVHLRPNGSVLIMTREAFAVSYAANATVLGNDRKKETNPVNIWVRSEDRIDISDYAMRPDLPPGVVEADGQWILNTYRAPKHGAPEPAMLVLFHRFMRHLIPDLAERIWFLDWLAHKKQHPDIPGCGVLHVCKQQGAGRGTLFRLIELVFGKDFVAKLDASVLFGDGGQSQYTNLIGGSIFCLLDEVMNTSANLSAYQRAKTYNRLKMLVEPGKRRMELIRKGLPSTVVTVYASWMMASNNENALPTESGDRRIAVLSSNKPLHGDPELFAAMKAAQPGGNFADEFVAAVAAFLEARDLSNFDVYALAPLFDGKQRMIDLNTHAVADAMEEALADLKRDLIQFKELQALVKAKLEYSDIPRDLRGEVLDAVGRSGWLFLGKKENITKSRRGLIYARHEAAARLWRDTPVGDERQTLLDTDVPASKADAPANEASAPAKTVRRWSVVRS